MVNDSVSVVLVRAPVATPAICQNLPFPLGTEKVFRCLIIGFLSPFLLRPPSDCAHWGSMPLAMDR